MSEIRPGIGTTDGTLAGGIDRLGIILVLCVLDHNVPGRGEEPGVDDPGSIHGR